MTDIVDVSYACGNRAHDLAAAGIKAVVRYYTRDSVADSPKRLALAEAQQHVAAGLRLIAVHEGRRGNRIDYFDMQTGFADGAYARGYAARKIGQPGGSAIYFGIDMDASEAEIEERVLPYFRGVAAAFAAATGEPDYAVGVYGSGLTCGRVLDAALARYAWLSQSTAWHGYQAFFDSGRWSLLQALGSSVAEVDCDPDTVGAGGAGDFTIALPATLASSRSIASVIARDGLQLRPTAGTELAPKRTLLFGTKLFPLGTEGSWTKVDLQGDGAADGFVASAFLSPVRPASEVAAALSPRSLVSDAACIPALIAAGSSAAGLAAARATATAALQGYPTNGCAEHLSALLRAAGIDVPMTAGAGALAALLEKRGWSRIGRGEQQPGDVGVTEDRGGNPGADHIYLVIARETDDLMLVADNQNYEQDAPHPRYASGKGKTPTAYFLRAC